MKTDRELLEQAARAAGIAGWWSGDDYCYGCNGNINVPVPWRRAIVRAAAEMAP